MKTVEKILHSIKRQGALSTKTLADECGITTMGIRQHLQAMKEDGLVDFDDIRAKVGRPARQWSLTEKGHKHFSDSHNELAVSLMESVRNVFGDEGVERVIRQREQKTLTQYRDAIKDCLNLQAKLETLAYLRDSEGYMAELKQEGDSFILIENHCPICFAASKCPALCQSEKNIFQTLLSDDYQVVREEHIIKGQRRCTYRVSSRP
ncbi:helix-turn-helix transcriptional regulator [Veronia pacifica]|uniref:Transcriptional regulator n=1 Tax=Veronia pacifica TaxID=1080227 RepID=A0A1C3EGQ4_9GAMM|nr:metalloregulator ArsR/SmtB family transcription factor [Veronia pacifica]ODA32389.1 transcriptional regulator [Veronia pacifica]